MDKRFTFDEQLTIKDVEIERLTARVVELEAERDALRNQEPAAWLIPGTVTRDAKLAQANGANAIPLYTQAPPAAAVPEGWKLVPVELTEKMHIAAVRTINRCTGNADFPPRVYRAMLAAAPTPEEQK